MTAPTPERDLFARLLPPDWVNALDPPGEATAYTPYVVTWLLVYQRVHAGASLAAAVAEFLAAFPAEAKPDVERVRDGALSAATGGYSRVRSRLDPAAGRAGVPPRRLSFAGTWALVKAFLGAVAAGGPGDDWGRRFDDLLRWAGQRKLADRPGRSAPRTVLPNRRKYPSRAGTDPPAGTK